MSSGAMGIGAINPMEQVAPMVTTRVLKSPMHETNPMREDNPTSKSYNNLNLPPTGQYSTKMNFQQNAMMRLDL